MFSARCGGNQEDLRLAVWISLFGRDVRGVEGGGMDGGRRRAWRKGKDTQRDVGWAMSAIVLSGIRHDHYMGLLLSVIRVYCRQASSPDCLEQRCGESAQSLLVMAGLDRGQGMKP
jgi:hypothetical protein